MQIKELDPAGQYAVIINNEYVTSEEVRAVSEKLKGFGINGVVLAGADLQEGVTYWGVYSPKLKAWQKKADGELFFYPSQHIAQAHINDQLVHWVDNYGWTPREFTAENVNSDSVV